MGAANWKEVRLPIGKEAEVVGVVRDFHFQSLHDRIQPVFLIHLPEWTNVVLVKFESGNTKDVISGAREVYMDQIAGSEFDFTFLDDKFREQYRADEQRSRLLAVFSVVTAVISCLGLFALTGYSLSRRTKEIGIRKIMEASGSAIMTLLSREHFKLVAVAILIAIPLSYSVINSWLETFSYRIAISWWLLGIPSFVMLLLSFLSMSFQLIKAWSLNPVEGLRDE